MAQDRRLTPEDLDELISRSVVKIVVPDTKTEGTGFVISKGVVLTSRHVVKNVPYGGSVQISTRTGPGDTPEARALRAMTAKVRKGYPEGTAITETGAARWPDLALLDLDERGTDLPAVLLDNSPLPPDADLVIGGFPYKQEPAYQTRQYRTTQRLSTDELGHRYFDATAESLDPGLSGSPAFTPEGFVYGIVRLTRQKLSTLGGFLVPVVYVLADVPELREAFDNPGPNAADWARALGAVALRKHHRDEFGRRFSARAAHPQVIDITLSSVGTAQRVGEWEVLTTVQSEADDEDAPAPARVSTADLKDGVLEALDHWSRRHTIVTADQVELLGIVLRRALLSEHLRQVLSDAESAFPPPLLRLRMDRTNFLASIPWEYVSLREPPAEAEAFLGARENGPWLATASEITFSRYLPIPATDLGQAELARVLVVVNGPQRRQEMADVANRLGAQISEVAGRLDTKIETSVTSEEFLALLSTEGPWDVVHYVGGGWGDKLSFRKTGSPSQMAPVPVTTVAAYISNAGAQVVVLHLEPQGPETAAHDSDVREFLGGSVRAVVLAEHVTTADHVVTFGSSFYRALGRGESVERAVQLGRIQLAAAPPQLRGSTDADAAAFGSVSVTTTQTGDVRLLTAASGGDLSTSISERTPSGLGQPPPRARGFAAVRRDDFRQ